MKRRFGKKPNLYKIENEKFLEMKVQEAGATSESECPLVVLDNGVVMQKLQSGHGTIHPRPSSIVYASYTGRLIDGTVFDSTEGQPLPALFRVRELIMGWQIALVRMYEGDKYRIWIPAKYGYGAVRMDDIPAYSTLEFDLELVKIAQI